jgi:hypothetical protein
MKKRISLTLALILCLGSICGALTGGLAESEPDGYVATEGWINDQQTYFGTWQQSYRQILNNHSGLILAYQGRTLEFYSNGRYVQMPCKPVSIEDITGDGIPELIFLEAANECRGDLYIYSSSGASTKGVLFVPGITRLGYDDVGLGFDIYLSSARGGTLVLEYYEYEWPWTLQLVQNAFGRFTALNYLRAEYDSSGYGNDRFYRNGSPISSRDYYAALQSMRDGRMMTLSNYFAADDSYYGLTMYWEDAVSVTNGNSAPTKTPSNWNDDGDVYGLTIDKLATRTGPGTQYDEGGTYNVKGEYIKVLAKAWDNRNDIWWVKCEIPYNGETLILWTGWKRFDHDTISLDDLPEEKW